MSVTDYKDWNPDQALAAFTSLKAHELSQAGHPAQTPTSADIVCDRINDGTLTACYIKGYLLIYDVGMPWSTDQLWLSELLVLKAMPEGTFDDYVSGLRQLAAQHGCAGIETGNSVLRPGLRRLYERAGFIPISESYYMEVP